MKSNLLLSHIRDRTRQLISSVSRPQPETRGKFKGSTIFFYSSEFPEKKLSFNPLKFLVAGYFSLTLCFSFLLMLPISSKTGTLQNFVDAFFMASSGISTTGLCVVDIGTYYTLFGQLVLMLDFQIGGIGYMAFIVYLAYLLQIKLPLRNQLIAAESIAGADSEFRHDFFLKVILFTFGIELIGAIILFFIFLQNYSFIDSCYFAVFHSVSAFCTAGFGLFPDSLMSWANNIPLNLTINIVSLLGGIGFYVLYEAYRIGRGIARHERRKRFSIHTKLALIVTAIILGITTEVIFLTEQWPLSTTISEQFLASLFQAISASTTDGFNTIDIGAMSSTSLFVVILVMLIGASPGSTGGGMKTTTLGVLGMTVWSLVKGKKETTIFKRTLSSDLKDRAFVIFFMFIAVMVLDVVLLTITERADFLKILFEVASALGNTGLSMGITSSLSYFAKIVLSLTMFLGRVGLLTIGLALVDKVTSPVRYPSGDLYIG